MSTPVPIKPQDAISGLGPKIILMGEAGTGKSHALRTLPPLGITPFVIATEQNFLQTCKDLLGSSMHYKFIAPQAENSFNDITDMLQKINILSYENLTKVVDPFKQKNNKILDVVSICNKFICDCCQHDFGSVATWGTDRAIVMDSFTGVSDMAFALVVGNKPVRAMPDYQVAQNALRLVLGPLTAQTKCMFVLIAHLEREKDDITGGTFLTIKSVGSKVGPDLPRMFSDVIRTRRNGTSFVWDTADTQSTVVARHLPIAANQSADFRPLVETWKKKGGVIASPSSTVEEKAKI